MLKNVSLNDKYKLENKFILVNGTQALVRATLIQKFRDEKENLKTAGFVTGYRGSPVGNVDLQFTKVKKLISDVQFLGNRFEFNIISNDFGSSTRAS